MFDVLKEIQQIGIVPVVKIDNEKDALPLAKALMDGGLPCAEITFRTAAAKAAIRAITKAFPDMLVGAGTVLTKEQADDAIAAGAKFIVSPGLNPEIVQYCIEKGYPITPGCSSPSDVECALSFGLDVVKFFPAEAAGGLAMIKAMSAPYTGVKFMPTGGINAKNLKSYLDFDKIIACGGSWMVKADLINNGDFDAIRQLTKEAVHEMLIGINSADEKEAKQTAALFETMFGMQTRDAEKSVWCGKEVEVMKYNGYGQKGHIAILTNYLDRAVRYLSSKGFAFDEDSKVYDEKGRLTLIYLKADFGGFAVHLSQK
mgnify:FL=1